jgi:signal transduction protein with GAF and PtsI domain
MEGNVSQSAQKSSTRNPEHELKTLSKISKSVQESQIKEDSFTIILRQIGDLVDFRSASLYMMSKSTNKLEEICVIGKPINLIDFVKFDMGSGISAWVAQKRRPILLNNVRKSENGTNIRSFLSIPISISQEISGVLNLAHDEPDAFTKHDAELLGVVASMLALLAERINHQRFESDKEAEIESLQQKAGSIEDNIGAEDEASVEQQGSNRLIKKKINNSLAIIAGNAQFLMMCMKNADQSVFRRLQAIDRETSSILNLTDCDNEDNDSFNDVVGVPLYVDDSDKLTLRR